MAGGRGAATLLRRAIKGGDAECVAWLRQRHPPVARRAEHGRQGQGDYLAWRGRQRQMSRDVAALQAAGWRMGEEAWTYVLTYYADTGHGRECVAALRELRKMAAGGPAQEEPPPAVTVDVYNVVLGSLCNIAGTTTGNLPAFEEVFAEMRADGIEPNAETYRLLLRQLRKDGNRSAVAETFVLMTRGGIAPTVQILNELICNAASVDEALQHLAEFQRRGVHANAHTFCSVLKVCAATGDVRTAEALFGHRRAPTVEEFNSLMRVHKTADGLEGARGVHDRMRRAGAAGNAATYAILLAACAMDADADAAEAYFREMHAAGFMRTKASMGSLMAVYAATQDAEKAEQLLEWGRMVGIPPSETTLRHFNAATGRPQAGDEDSSPADALKEPAGGPDDAPRASSA